MSEWEYAKGGYLPAREELQRVKVRLSEGRREYWEPELSRWVPILTAEEIRNWGTNTGV